MLQFGVCTYALVYVGMRVCACVCVCVFRMGAQILQFGHN